jgi:hypothetical protein
LSRHIDILKGRLLRLLDKTVKGDNLVVMKTDDQPSNPPARQR